MPSLSTSDLQPFSLFPHPHLPPPRSEPNFHNIQLDRSKREGKQRSRDRVKTHGGGVHWQRRRRGLGAKGLDGLFRCG